MDGLSPSSSSLNASQPSAWPDDKSTGVMRALIVATDRLVALGVARLLEHVGVGVEIQGNMEAALSGPAVMLVIVHAGMPGLSTAQVAELVQCRQATALLGAAGEGATVGLSALRGAGARGMLTGTETPAMCAGMIQLLLVGGSCWSADHLAFGGTATTPPHRAPEGPVHLTARQWEIAEGLVRGESNKVIGHTLGITEGTVKIHLTALFRALGVQSRTAAVVRLIPLARPAPHQGEMPAPNGWRNG